MAFHGLQTKQALANKLMLSRLSVMIAVGKKNSRAVREAKRLEAIFKRNQPYATAEKMTDRTLFYLPMDTSLQGTKMLGESSIRLEPRIAWFIEKRLVDQNYPWKNRNPGKKTRKPK
jgi:hypothetical protein